MPPVPIASRVAPVPSVLRSLLAIGVIAALGGACRSSQAYREAADSEVYDIIRERRQELEADGAFTIEPPADSLRERILRGDIGTAEAPLEPMTLVDALQIASENSRDYQTRRETLYLVALDLTLERWRFSAQEAGVFGAILDGDGNAVNRATGFANLAITKLFVTGARFFADVGMSFVHDIGNGNGFDAVSNASLSITQPLLRGFGSDIVTEPLTQAERDVLYEARSYERFRNTFAVDVATRFYRILEQTDRLENERRNLERLIEIRKRNAAFADAGRMKDIEVDQARQDELSAQDAVISAERELQRRLDEFKFFLGLPPDTHVEVAAGELERLTRWLDIEVEIEDERATAVALERRLDYRTTEDLVEDAERRVVVAADSLRAGLDLAFEGAAVSERGKPLEFDDRAVPWTLRLDVDLPLDRLPERNAYRAALVDLDAAQREAVGFADDIQTSLRDLRRALVAARASYEIQTGAVVLAERRVQSAQLNLEAGRASTRDVLESQQSLVRAENAATGALIEYTIAGLNFYLDMEVLQVDETGLSIDTSFLQEDVDA